MAEYPLQLERYFFTHQEVVANPDHIANGRKDGSQLKSEVNANLVEGRSNAFAVSVRVFLDNESSDNPPYFFHIEAFGIFVLASDLPSEASQQLATTSGAILIGAIRERLADLTSRGPWGGFMIPPIPVEFQASAIRSESND